MIVPAQHVRIVVATMPVDFGRGHDGLAATVQRELGLDPHSGVIVVFRAKRADRLEILVWDGSGLVMIYKRLEEGRFALRGLPVQVFLTWTPTAMDDWPPGNHGRASSRDRIDYATCCL